MNLQIKQQEFVFDIVTQHTMKVSSRFLKSRCVFPAEIKFVTLYNEFVSPIVNGHLKSCDFINNYC